MAQVAATWPASWSAVRRQKAGSMVTSGATTPSRATAERMSDSSMTVRAGVAMSASPRASSKIWRMSAGVLPRVIRAALDQSIPASTRRRDAKWRKSASRSGSSGTVNATTNPIRPERRSAGSRALGAVLDEQTTSTPGVATRPSSPVSMAVRVRRLLSVARSEARCRAKPSISSM